MVEEGSHKSATDDTLTDEETAEVEAIAAEFVEKTIRKQQEQQKETLGWWATWVWIITGISLYLITPGRSLFTWSAVIFIGVGMLASAIVFGSTFYVVTRSISAALIWIGRPFHSRGLRSRRRWQLHFAGAPVSFVGLLGWVLFVGQILIVALTGRWAFHAFG